jgi:hypothetical protein
LTFVKQSHANPFLTCIFVAEGDSDGLRGVDKTHWIGKALVLSCELRPQAYA